MVADIRASGANSLRGIAAELNTRGMLTRRSGRWHVSTVTNLLDRLGTTEQHAPVPFDVACRGDKRTWWSVSLSRATQIVAFPLLGLQPSIDRAQRPAGAGVHGRVDRAEASLRRLFEGLRG